MEVMLKAKRSTKETSQAIGCSQRTVQREQQRGQIQQLSTGLEYFSVYDADYAQTDYTGKHEGKGASLKIGYDHALCLYIEKEIKAKKSPDVIAKAIRQNPTKYLQPLCTKTIYNYLEKSIFLNVSYKDLTCGHYRKKNGKAVNRPSYKNLKGRGIEERPQNLEDRQEAGHWEMDLVLGKKSSSKTVLLTLTERTSRREIIRKLPDKTQISVIQALDVMERQMGRRQFQRTFKRLRLIMGQSFWVAAKLNSLV